MEDDGRKGMRSSDKSEGKLENATQIGRDDSYGL